MSNLVFDGLLQAFYNQPMNTAASQKKRPLTPEESEECRVLKSIYDKKKRELGLTQETIGHEFGVTTGAVGHYLRGRNALNLTVALGFAKILKVPVSCFSQRLAEQIGDHSSIKDEIVSLFSRLPEGERDFQLKQLRDRVEFLEQAREPD